MSKIDSIKSAGAGAASFANHVIGGAVVGAAVNTAAYANGGALTNSQTAGQAFMSGAGWGAAIGGGFGVGGYQRAMRLSAAESKNRAKASAKAIGHAQGDKSTSIYGNIKNLLIGNEGKEIRNAKLDDLAKQADKIMQKNLERTSFESPAYLRRGKDIKGVAPHVTL